jgi:hypothetical protein
MKHPGSGFGFAAPEGRLVVERAEKIVPRYRVPKSQSCVFPGRAAGVNPEPVRGVAAFHPPP